MGCKIVEQMQRACKMNELEVRAIEKHVPEVLDIEATSVIDYLIQNGHLNLHHDVHTINTGKTPRDRMMALVQIVTKKPLANSFEIFLDVLGRRNGWLAAKIRFTYQQLVQEGNPVLQPQILPPAPPILPAPPPIQQAEEEPEPLMKDNVEKKVRVNFNSRHHRALGLQVAAGQEYPRWPNDKELYVIHLEPGKPAHKSGMLKVKDTLHKVNGQHVGGMTVERLSKVFGLDGEAVTSITVRRWAPQEQNNRPNIRADL